MSFAMKYLLCIVSLAFAADTQIGQPLLLYSALYHAIFLYVQLRTDSFAYIIPPADTAPELTVNPATGLPMAMPGAHYGFDVGGNLYGCPPPFTDYPNIGASHGPDF